MLDIKYPIIAVDPGDHIGLVFQIDEKGPVCGGTFVDDYATRLQHLWVWLNLLKPKTILFEQFALRENKAKKLVGNKFITCEVIGVIKLYADLNKEQCDLYEMLPVTKEYCGFSSNPKDEHYKNIQMLAKQKITEHTRDAYRLLSYHKLFGGKKYGEKR